MSIHVVVPDHVENDVAYRAAAEARIRANAVRGRHKRWLAIEGNQRLYDFLFECGEFEREFVLGSGRGAEQRSLAVKLSYNSNFLTSMRDNILQYGALSDKQTKAAIAAMDRCFKSAEKIEQERANSSSQHIGVVGQKHTFDATIKSVREIQTHFGLSFVHNIVDEQSNNVVLFSTKQLGGNGETLRITATVKKHDDYQGVAQTVISRAKISK